MRISRHIRIYGWPIWFMNIIYFAAAVLGLSTYPIGTHTIQVSLFLICDEIEKNRNVLVIFRTTRRSWHEERQMIMMRSPQYRTMWRPPGCALLGAAPNHKKGRWAGIGRDDSGVLLGSTRLATDCDFRDFRHEAQYTRHFHIVIRFAKEVFCWGRRQTR